MEETIITAPARKIAVITGASRGIGAGLVESYRKLGYAVVGTSRTIVPTADPDILAIQGDISDPATAERVIAAGIAHFGRIDTLINNAGVFIPKPFTDYTQDDYETIISVNLSGFFHITQLAIERMIGQGSGHIVQITTSTVDHAYSAVSSALTALTKGGLQSATKALAIEYASRGIRCNAVSLGVVKTPMHPEEYHEALAAMVPVGRLGEIGDVTDAVRFLEGAPYVTGAILHVDGGISAGH